jgi:hypothetical protein
MNATDSVKAAALGIGDRLIIDIHDQARGAIARAEKLFSAPTGKDWGAVNLETNCGDHTIKRMLEEAMDLNDFFLYANPTGADGEGRMKARASSFCMERSGYNEVADRYGYCLSCIVPSLAWIEPLQLSNLLLPPPPHRLSLSLTPPPTHTHPPTAPTPAPHHPHTHTLCT